MSPFLTLKELKNLPLESQILAWLVSNTLLLTDKQLVTLYLLIGCQNLRLHIFCTDY